MSNHATPEHPSHDTLNIKQGSVKPPVGQGESVKPPVGNLTSVKPPQTESDLSVKPPVGL